MMAEEERDDDIAVPEDALPDATDVDDDESVVHGDASGLDEFGNPLEE